MRTLGVAILGVFLGLVAGFLLFSEVIARAVVQGSGEVEAPWTFVIGFGPQVFAVVGAVVAVLVDRRARERKAKEGS